MEEDEAQWSNYSFEKHFWLGTRHREELLTYIASSFTTPLFFLVRKNTIFGSNWYFQQFKSVLEKRELKLFRDGKSGYGIWYKMKKSL